MSAHRLLDGLLFCGRIAWELGDNWIVATITGKVAMITEEVATINTKVARISPKVAIIQSTNRYENLNLSAHRLLDGLLFVGESSGN